MSSPLTASQIDRAQACPASVALPAVILPSSYDASRGTAIHRFLEIAAKSGREVALAEVPQDAPWRATCEAIPLTEIFLEGARLETEISIAYNSITNSTRILGSSIGRNYNASPQEIVGTIDLLITNPDGSVVVIDYKTGAQTVYVTDSNQLRFLGLAIARALNLVQVTVAIIQIASCGEFRRDELLLTEELLTRIAHTIRTTFDKVSHARQQVACNQVPDVRVGDHCRYCPAFRGCPANISLAKELISPQQNISSVIKEMTPKEAGIVWERLVSAKRILAEIEEGLHAYIDQDPIPLPDGRQEVVRIDSVRETIIGRAAVSVLYEHLGEAADAVIEPSVTKSALNTVIKELSASQPEANLLTEVMVSLRQVGAIKETPMVRYQAKLISHRRT